MTRRTLLALLALCLAAAPAPPAEREAPPLRIHIISGSKEYQSEPSLRAFQRELEEKYRVRITATWAQDQGKTLPDVEQLKDAELLLIFARRITAPPEQMAVVRAHWEAGKPVVGIRTASHAFGPEDNKVFDREVLGGDHRSHYGDEPVRVEPAAAGKGHPALKGVGTLASRKLYKVGEMAPGATVLQTGTIKAPDGKPATQPVTWVHEYKGGRVFYTSLGVPEDFEREDFRRMLTNAVFWAAREAAEVKK